MLYSNIFINIVFFFKSFALIGNVIITKRTATKNIIIGDEILTFAKGALKAKRLKVWVIRYFM